MGGVGQREALTHQQVVVFFRKAFGYSYLDIENAAY